MDLGELAKSSLFTSFFFIVNDPNQCVEIYNVIFVRNFASWAELFGRLSARKAVSELC